MTLVGGYFAATLAVQLMHWVVIISAGISLIGMLWLWEDFLAPRIDLGKPAHADRHGERGDGAGIYRQTA